MLCFAFPIYAVCHGTSLQVCMALIGRLSPSSRRHIIGKNLVFNFLSSFCVNICSVWKYFSTPTDPRIRLASIISQSLFNCGYAKNPNGQSYRILCELSKELSIPYCSLFYLSLREGIIPSSYKEDNVCTIPKKGGLTDVINYRPVSLLNSGIKF